MEDIDKQEALRQIETIKKAVIERRYIMPLKIQTTFPPFIFKKMI